MTIPLPSSIATASQWQLVDWTDPQLQSQPAVGSVATIEVPQLASDEMWLVDRAVIVCDSSTATTMRLYRDAISPRNIRSGSSHGNFDEADYPGGLLVRPTSRLVAQWVGASAGAIATLTLQARVLRRT